MDAIELRRMDAMQSIKHVHDLKTMLTYFENRLNWDIDLCNFDDIEDISYKFDAEDVGLKAEEFSKISSLRQLRPITENQPWGIFAIEFDSKNFESAALRKVLSGLIPKRRNSEHPMWDKKNLMFLCFWGEEPTRTIGIAHFKDSDSGLPQIKMLHITPRIEDSSRLAIFEGKLRNLIWPQKNISPEVWQRGWAKTFNTTFGQVIRDSKTLTDKLAIKAKEIRSVLLGALQVEATSGHVHQMYHKFKSILIHDMTEEDFANMYAQTIVYGLFSARCMVAKEAKFIPADAIDQIPNTNPFLRNLLKDCFTKNNGLSFDELELTDIIELLANTDTEIILQDFNRITGGGKEDPVIYFYENFLDAYESAQKKRRGVYYTPQPIVTFIVRAVDELLKNEFSAPEGLASLKMQILDPATGTGTFLRQTILQVYENFKISNKCHSSEEIQMLWNEYVPTQLLPGIYGFELMMAPYAVAHMKLAMVLHETGYDFAGHERVNVFLSDALENAEKREQQVGDRDPLAIEAQKANFIKDSEVINIVFGNPPYNVESANKGEWIMKLMEDYKYEPGTTEKLKERNSKVINNDYVKFIRLAQYLIRNKKEAIIAFINPHGFLSDLTYRGVRWSLLTEFDEIYVLDLHGNIMKKEFAANGPKDENVFDIQQGVSINFFVKKSPASSSKQARVYYADIVGTREEKYDKLRVSTFKEIKWQPVNICAPNYSFIIKDFSNFPKYEQGLQVTELFPINISGVKTHDDENLISNASFEKKCDCLYDYRPFDIKHINYDLRKVLRHRNPVMKNFVNRDNYGFVVSRQAVTDNWSHVQVVRNMIDNRLHYSNKGIANECPMYIYNDNTNCRTPNVNMQFVSKFETCTGLRFIADLNEGNDTFSMLDLFDYAYAVLHSPAYRQTYIGFLKEDFPRIIYPFNLKMFRELATYGKRLRNAHLMESPLEDFIITDYPVGGTNVVEKPVFKDNCIYINKTQFFSNVPELAWEFFFGGYQPAQKWLKDRKGQPLTTVEICHYQKVIAVLIETSNIMSEIDENIDLFGYGPALT